MLTEHAVQEFEACRGLLEHHARALASKLEHLVAQRSLATQFVSYRVKSVESLRRKLARPDKSYASLWQVTDLVGLRIGTYFEDTLEALARAIEETFEVDFANSTDKARFTDHGRFGYRSLHYVCALRDGPNPDFRFEIQLRTVLQHAWAEVEHDLGYHSGDAVPDGIRRRFSRIASLLEIADQEFVSIRADLQRHQNAVRESLATGAAGLNLDVVSLEALTRLEPVVALDTAVAAALGKKIADEVFFAPYLATMLRLVGLRTTSDVLEAIEKYAPQVAAVVPRYFEFANVEWQFDAQGLQSVLRGYGLFFIAHLHVVRGPDLGLSKVARLTKVYLELDYPGDERTAHRVASALIDRLGA